MSDDNKFIFVGSYNAIKMLDIETKQEFYHFNNVGQGNTLLSSTKFKALFLGDVNQIKVSRNNQRIFSRYGASISVIDLKANDELSSHRYIYSSNNNSFI